MKPAASAPAERLNEGTLGPVLERANQQFAAHVDESAAFRRLSERLESPRPTLFVRGRWAFALLPLGVTLVAVARWATAPREVASISAEPVRSAAARVIQVPRLASSSQPRASAGDATRPATRAPLAPAAESPRRARASAGLATAPAREHPSESASAAPRALSAPPSAERPSPAVEGPDCLSLARAGSARDAEACFLKRAGGAGIGAEMALYEVARLRRDVLADEDGALSALAAYRRRFPAGSLRREANMSELELLVQFGRSDEALRLAEELLTSSLAAERGAELHLLRGHILRKSRGDLREAEHEYAAAERAPGNGRLDAIYFRGLCLQGLGDADAAGAAYRRYLEQGGRSHAAEAKQRLEGLSP